MANGAQFTVAASLAAGAASVSTTLNDIRAAIEGRIATEMALSPAYPVSYQNAPYVQPNNSTWLGVQFRFGDSAYLTLLGPSTGFNQQNGTVIVNIYTPLNSGAGANFTVAERIKNLFSRVKLTSIIFDAPSGPAQVLPAQPGSFFQTRIITTFTANLD